MIILYPIVILLMFYSLGMATIKLFKLQKIRLINNNDLIPFAIGFVVNLTILETLGMILPIFVVSFFLVVVSALGFVWCYQEIKNVLMKNINCEKEIFLLLLLPIIILMLPQIMQNELFSVIDGNNDIGYYVASIEWLKNHSIFETVAYSHAHPFFSMAEYMLNLTRIGTDLTGAYVANIFSLESYQAYSILIPISGVIISISIYSVSKYFTDSNFSGIVVGLYASICGNCISMIAMQYIPQILGVAYLILGFISLYELFFEKSKGICIFVGIIVSGLLAVYCEYTIYLLFVALVFFVVTIIQKKFNLKTIFCTVMFTIGFNVLGFYKAVKFNLEILANVLSRGLGTIDPFQGNMIPVWRKLGVIFGFTGREIGNLGLIYKISAILGLILIITCLVLPIIKKNYGQLLFASATIGVVIFLEIYFLHGNAAYEEYKHLTSSAFITLANISVMLGLFINSSVYKKIFEYSSLAVMSFVLIFSISIPLWYYIQPPATFDSATMALQEAATLVPSNEEIAIDETVPTADYMGAVYALKDRAVKLNSGANTYLQFFQTFEEDNNLRYTIYPRSQEIAVLSDNIDVLWANEKYLLTENKDLESYRRLNITGAGWQHQNDAVVFPESGCIISTKGSEGFPLFGPYSQMDGIYDIKLEYTVLQADDEVGYFCVCNGDEEIIVSESLDSSSNTIEFKNVNFDNKEKVEFRVFANAGTVIKVEGVLCMEVKE